MSAALLPAWSLPNFCRTAKGNPSTPCLLLKLVRPADDHLDPTRSTRGFRLRGGVRVSFLRAVSADVREQPWQHPTIGLLLAAVGVPET